MPGCALSRVRGKGPGKPTHRDTRSGARTTAHRRALRSIRRLARRNGGRGARDAARHAGFFAEIGKTWRDVPDYAALVAHFGAEGLRRQRRPMRWMAEQRLVPVDAAAREDDSERRRIAATMERLPEGSHARGGHGRLLRRAQGAGALGKAQPPLYAPGAYTRGGAARGGARGRARTPLSRDVGCATPRNSRTARVAREFVRWLREMHDVSLALPPKRGGAALRQRRAPLYPA